MRGVLQSGAGGVRASRALIAPAAIFAAAALASPAATARECAELAAVRVPGTAITAATAIPAGGAREQAGLDDISQPGDLPAFCRVAGRIETSSASSIAFEVWLPEAAWNGDFLANGYSFYGAPIDTQRLADAVRRGFATAGTDGGSGGERSASHLLGASEKLVDWGERAWHATTLTAKALIGAYYGRSHRFAYWEGCGGEARQGLKAAQIYPNDFDGIAVGGIAHDTTHFAFAQMWQWEALRDFAAASADVARDLGLLHRAALGACDARDGATDGIIARPQQCTFDPGVAVCSGDDTQPCLAPEQVDAARRLYSPVANPRTGARIFSPLMPGSELAWRPSAEPSSYAVDFFKYIVFEDPRWDPIGDPIDYDEDVALAEAVHPTVNATDPNLREFIRGGGKLLMYGGWNDTAIPPGANTQYHAALVGELGEEMVANSARLFMVPGMGHCPGPGFGGAATYEFDPLSVLSRWRETGVAPQRLVVERRVEGEATATFVVCANGVEARAGAIGSRGCDD